MISLLRLPTRTELHRLREFQTCTFHCPTPQQLQQQQDSMGDATGSASRPKRKRNQVSYYEPNPEIDDVDKTADVTMTAEPIEEDAEDSDDFSVKVSPKLKALLQYKCMLMNTMIRNASSAKPARTRETRPKRRGEHLPNAMQGQRRRRSSRSWTYPPNCATPSTKWRSRIQMT